MNLNDFMKRAGTFLFVCLIFPAPATAEVELVQSTATSPSSSEDYLKLKEKLDLLTQEVESLKGRLPENQIESEYPSFSLGITAELMQFQELRDNDSAGRPRPNESRTLRIAPRLQFQMHRNMRLNTRISFGNGGAESHDNGSPQQGEAIIEEAFVEWTPSRFGVRAGHQFVPMGTYNLNVDPTLYFGVQPSEVETMVLPGRWHENGFAVFYTGTYLHAQVGVFNSLDASSFEPKSFIKEGRQNGQSAKSEDLLSVARLDFGNANMSIGGSYGVGETNQNNETVDHATLALWEGHIQAHYKALRLSALYTEGHLGSADNLSALNGEAMGSRVQGWTWTAAFCWDLPIWKLRWDFFYRQDNYNLNAKVPDGYTPNRALSKSIDTFGMQLLPRPDLILKLDYQKRDNKLYNEEDLFEFSIGVVL